MAAVRRPKYMGVWPAVRNHTGAGGLEKQAMLDGYGQHRRGRLRSPIMLRLWVSGASGVDFSLRNCALSNDVSR